MDNTLDIHVTTSTLLIRPFGLLLLRESLHANLLIPASKEAMEHPPLILNTLPERQLLALINNLLTSNNSNTAIASNLLRSLNSLLKQLVLAAINNLGCNTPLAGLLAAEHVAREDQFHRLALAHSAGKTLRATGTGDRTELDLGLAEVRVRRAVQDVAHQCELAATAESVAGDGGDHGLADRVGEVRPGCDEVVVVGGGEGERGHFFDVRAGCSVLGLVCGIRRGVSDGKRTSEGLLAASDDDCTDALVLIVLGESVVQLREEGAAEGI